jgi:hypothetical protein
LLASPPLAWTAAFVLFFSGIFYIVADFTCGKKLKEKEEK